MQLLLFFSTPFILLFSFFSLRENFFSSSSSSSSSFSKCYPDWRMLWKLNRGKMNSHFFSVSLCTFFEWRQLRSCFGLFFLPVEFQDRKLRVKLVDRSVVSFLSFFLSFSLTLNCSSLLLSLPIDSRHRICFRFPQCHWMSYWWWLLACLLVKGDSVNHELDGEFPCSSCSCICFYFLPSSSSSSYSLSYCCSFSCAISLGKLALNTQVLQ